MLSMIRKCAMVKVRDPKNGKMERNLEIWWSVSAMLNKKKSKVIEEHFIAP